MKMGEADYCKDETPITVVYLSAFKEVSDE